MKTQKVPSEWEARGQLAMEQMKRRVGRYRLYTNGQPTSLRYDSLTEAVEHARQCLETLPPVKGAEVRAEVVAEATGCPVWTGWRVLSATECVERVRAAGYDSPPAWWWRRFFGARPTQTEALAESGETAIPKE